MLELTAIGRSLKPHGKLGFIKLNIEEAFVDDLAKASALFIDLDGSKVPFLIEKLDIGNNLMIKLDEVDNPEEASLLGSKDIFMDASEISQETLEAVDAEMHDLLGFKVLNEAGELQGIISQIIDNKHQLLIEIEMPEKKIFWPLHEDLILKLDEENATIILDLIEGFDAL